MQEIGLDSTLIKHILDGSKSIEGRLGKPKFLKLRVGDELLVRQDTYDNDTLAHSEQTDIRLGITQILYFESFDEMLTAIDYKQVVPFANSKQDALSLYRKFYTPEDEEAYGVVALILKVHQN